MEKIFAYSVTIHGTDIEEPLVLSDTTVQENNIAFPTDEKLAKKIIDKCNAIADKEHVHKGTWFTKLKGHGLHFFR